MNPPTPSADKPEPQVSEEFVIVANALVKELRAETGWQGDPSPKHNDVVAVFMLANFVKEHTASAVAAATREKEGENAELVRKCNVAYGSFDAAKINAEYWEKESRTLRAQLQAAQEATRELRGDLKRTENELVQFSHDASNARAEAAYLRVQLTALRSSAEGANELLREARQTMRCYKVGISTCQAIDTHFNSLALTEPTKP